MDNLTLANSPVMQFKTTAKFFKSKPETFSSINAPDWITSVKTVPGSTMDNRWFWNDYVLTLKLNESVETDFQVITRVE